MFPGKSWGDKREKTGGAIFSVANGLEYAWHKM